MFTRIEPGDDLSGCAYPDRPAAMTETFGPYRTTTAAAPVVPGGAAVMQSRLGKHDIEVLRQFSAGTGKVTSGQAVCSTCHWEGPLRFGTGAKMLDIDAARHAKVSSGDRGAPLVTR